MKKYICIGCKYVGETSFLQKNKNNLICFKCKNLNHKKLSEEYIRVYKHYEFHSMYGQKCVGCDRLIFINKESICPFPDCLTINLFQDNKKNKNPQEEYFDCEEKINKNLLDSIIQVENNLIYHSYTSTLIQKTAIIQAIKNIYTYDSNFLIDSIILNKHNNFLSVVFQKFINILEAQMPITYYKNKKIYKINSILDESFHIFEGEAIFNSIITDDNLIYNQTCNIYTGSRKGSYNKPYFLGKILSITKEDGSDIDYEWHDFNKIKIADGHARTQVCVKHLQIPSHYSMGALLHINNIKKELKEKINEK